MLDPPRGTVTFLFTDIEGSTALWERDRTAMASAVARHLTLLDAAIAAHGGVHFKTVGDAVQAAFPTAPEAVTAALAAQQSLLAEDWDAVGPLRVRMALHAGKAEPDPRGDYITAPLNRLSRLLATGHGGQILLTQAVQQLTRGALPSGTELRDLGEHRLRDLLEPERVFQLVHPGVPSEFPALRALEAHLHNLPVQLTPLVGRDAEVEAIQSLITEHGARFVTLTGPGGTGKTRLALAVAAELLDAFPDGVWFVDLAPLVDPALVLPTLARTLGLRESSDRSLNHLVSVFLVTKRLLLVLDSYEHLLAAATVASDLLRAGPGNAIVVTSREPLRLRGEREVAVAPLAVPVGHQHRSRADLAQNPAVALFVVRAQAVKADFVLTDENAAAVAAICRRVDGLPLAIELAAARIKVLPPSALLARLDTRLPLLAGGPRDAPARQRTLRDTIAWSHDLLTEPEQTLFRQLAVFVGGFSLEAAEAVAGAGGDFCVDLFEGIASFVDKSLLRQEEEPGHESRYVMLETIHEFALEHLREHADEAAAIRRAHAGFFADLAITAQPGLGSGVPAIVRRVRIEEDNLRAMLAHMLEAGDIETALQVAGGSLSFFWTSTGGQFTEARAWLDRALREGADASAAARAWGFCGLALIALFQGDLVTARTAAIECRVLAHATDDPMLAVRGPLVLGQVEEAEGRMDAVARLAVEAVEAARAMDDPGILGWSLMSLSSARRHAGDLQEAASALEEALALFRGVGGVWGEADTLVNLAGVARAERSLARAARLYADSLQLRRNAGVLANASDGLVRIAEIAHIMGYVEPAARLLGAEDTYLTVFGSVGWGVTPMLREQTRQALIEQLGDEPFQRAWAAGRALSTEQMIAEAISLSQTLAASPQ